MINRMVLVLDAVLDDPTRRFQPLVRPHHTHRRPLHEDIALGEQLQRLQRRPVGTDQPLASLRELLLVPHHAPDLDDIALHLVVQDLQRLRRRNAPREQLDHVAGLHDDVRVVRLARRLDRHGAFHEVQFTSQTLLFQGFRDRRPYFPEILLPVLWEERRERGFLQETVRVVILRERVDLPPINRPIVPRLFLPVLQSVSGAHAV